MKTADLLEKLVRKIKGNSFFGYPIRRKQKSCLWWNWHPKKWEVSYETFPLYDEVTETITFGPLQLCSWHYLDGAHFVLKIKY